MDSTRKDTDGTAGSSLPPLRAEGALLLGMIIVAVLALLVLSGHIKYLAYHSIIELFVAAVALAIFTVAWHTRRVAPDDFLTALGLTEAWVAAVTILHTLAYRGMSVLPMETVTLGSQLWIILQAIQAAGLVIAPYYIGRKMRHPGWFFVGMGAVAGAATIAAFAGIFPVTYVTGAGLTMFKVGAEYVIIAAMSVALYLTWRKRDRLEPAVGRDLMIAIACMIGAELLFTFYFDLYDVFNVLGHVLHLAAFYFIYRALVARSLEDPFSSLFRELVHREESLLEANRLSEGLSRIAMAINSSFDTDSIMSTAVVEASDVVGADGAVLSLLDDSGTHRIRYAHGHGDHVIGLPLERDEAPHVYLATEEASPVVIADSHHDERAGTLAERFGLRSLLSVPLVSQGKPAGVLSFGWTSPADSVNSHRLHLFAQKLAAALSLALANARLYEAAHKVAETLQSAMSVQPDSVAGLEIGHVYRPSPGIGRIGGDFYDVFALSDGRVAFTLGDVSGKGIEAAAMSARTRSTIRALAYAEPDPASVLERVNDALLHQIRDGEFVTAAYGLVHLETLEVSIGLAGHPEPVVCGRPDLVPAEELRNPPLGVLDWPSFEVWRFTLGPNDTMVLYSDGIFEARRDGELFGLHRVREILATCPPGGPQQVAEELLAAVERFGTDGPRDDAAVLALRPAAR